MTNLLSLIGNTLSKHGLFPAMAIFALVLGGYGCYTAQCNSLAIQQQVIDLAKLKARIDANPEKLTNRPTIPPAITIDRIVGNVKTLFAVL